MFQAIYNTMVLSSCCTGKHKNSRREGLKTIVLFLLLRAPVYGKFNTFPVQQGLKTIVGDKIIHNSILVFFLLKISPKFSHFPNELIYSVLK